MAKKYKKIKFFYLVASLFLVFSLPLISEASTAQQSNQQDFFATYSTAVSADGAAVTGAISTTGMQVGIQENTVNVTAGATINYGSPVILNSSNSAGSINLNETINAGNLASSQAGQTIAPQNLLVINNLNTSNPNAVTASNGQVLTSITITSGSIVSTQNVVFVNGVAQMTLPVRSGNLTITYNFETGGGGGGGGATPVTQFAGSLTVAPKIAGAPFGIASFADYTVTFKSYSDYSGPVIISLEGACPVTSCVFTTGTSGTIIQYGTTFAATLRLSSSAAFAQGQYEFKVNASPTGGAGDSDRVIQNGFYYVYKDTPANAYNKAQYVSYANLPAGNTMQPGETRQVTVTMKNVGTTDWTLNTGGATCSSVPKNNGYYLHPQNNVPTWGVDKVALNSDSTNGIVANLPAGRYVRISGLGNSFSSGTGYLGVFEIQAFDSNGIIHHTQTITQSSAFSPWGGTTLLGAADSNTATGFVPYNGSSNQWIQIDYGSSKNFTEIKVLPAVQGAWNDDPMQVQISSDGVNFTTVATFISDQNNAWFSTKKAVGGGLPYYKYLN